MSFNLQGKSIKPSSFFPDYFKLDLSVGMKNQNPIVQVLDQILEDFYYHESASLFWKTTEFLGVQESKQYLTNLGMKVSTLSSEEVIALYKLKDEILDRNCLLATVGRIVNIFFSDATTVKGWPYPCYYLGQSTQTEMMTVPEFNEHKIIYLEVANDKPLEKVTELEQTLQVVLKNDYVLKIKYLSQVTHKKKQSLVLTQKGFRLE